MIMEYLGSWRQWASHRWKQPNPLRKAGIAHAKANDDTSYLGRKPSFTRRQFEQIKQLHANDTMNLSGCRSRKSLPANRVSYP